MFFLTIVLIIFLYVISDYNLGHNLDLLIQLILVTVVGVYTLLDLSVTPEFEESYFGLSHVLLVYLGTARIIYNILFNKSKSNTFDNTKLLLKTCFHHIKKNIYII